MCVTLRCNTNLAIFKSGRPTTLTFSAWLTYTLLYSNNGFLTATSVLITDVVPAILTNVSATSSGAHITPTGSLSYTWQVEDLSPGEGGAITITARVSPSLRCCMPFTNSAQITADTPDFDPTNNASGTSTTVTYCLYLPIVMRNPT